MLVYGVVTLVLRFSVETSDWYNSSPDPIAVALDSLFANSEGNPIFSPTDERHSVRRKK